MPHQDQPAPVFWDGQVLIAVAAAALVTGLASSVAPSTITGAGLCLLAFGLATLARGGPAPDG